MWQLLGGGTVSPETEELTLGSVDGQLTDGTLPLRFQFIGASDWRPLSFGVIVPVAEADDCGLPTGRVYPQTALTVVCLGPGLGGFFKGRIVYRPRNYNRLWLRFDQPVRAFNLICWVWLPGGVTDPVVEFKLFTDQLGGKYQAGPQRVGPAGAAPLVPHG